MNILRITPIPIVAVLVVAFAAAAQGPGQPVVRILVPEVYELANIAIAISDYGLDEPFAVERTSAYYRRVMEHFLPYRSHALVDAIDPLVSASFRSYYSFRENAFRFEFQESLLREHNAYRAVWQPDHFAGHRRLVEGFAKETGFRDFYRSERSAYADMIERYRRQVSVAQMSAWLDRRFPGHDVRAFTVVFSPLINGSHSTSGFPSGDGIEAVMFVAGPDLRIDGVNAAVRNALHARILFTEIDHNFVNPISDRFGKEIARALAPLSSWNSGSGYASPYLTFNEYMTWGVFTLYAREIYDATTFHDLNARNERLMENRRGFVRFAEFNRELQRLDRARGGQGAVEELYEPMLRWIARQSVAQSRGQ